MVFMRSFAFAQVCKGMDTYMRTIYNSRCVQYSAQPCSCQKYVILLILAKKQCRVGLNNFC